MSWQRTLSVLLYPFIFEENDRKFAEIESLKLQKESFRQRINILEDDKNELKQDLIAVKQNRVKTDLLQFKTNRTYKINGTRMKISQWLNNIDEKGHVGDWVEANLDLSLLKGDVDSQARQLRLLIYDEFGNKDIHVPETKDTWQKPSEFIEGGFKGDCDDWATFIYYAYDYVFGPLNKLYFALVGLNHKDGFNWGNHATLLWKHNDEKYYVLDSAVGRGLNYIDNSIDAFGEIDYTRNFKYGRVVYLSNNKSNYYQVIL
jgi:hypothetical protein